MEFVGIRLMKVFDDGKGLAALDSEIQGLPQNGYGTGNVFTLIKPLRLFHRRGLAGRKYLFEPVSKSHD